MSVHPTDTQLRAFLAGDVDDNQAVELAVHLDDCPHCTGRVERLDPLAAVFAAAPDVRAPESLAAAVLDAAERPFPWLTPELLLGAGFLVASATLVVLAGDPLDGLVAARVVLEGLRDAGDQLARSLLASSAPLAGLMLAGLALAAATVGARTSVAWRAS